MVLSLLKSALLSVLFIQTNCVDVSTWKSVIERTRNLYKIYGTKQSVGPYNYETCFNDVITFYEGIDQALYWAVRMYDSWGNIPSGSLSGNVYSLGFFDQCVNSANSTLYCLARIEFSSVNSTEISNPRFLRMKPETLHFMDPIHMLVGICYPSSCSPHLQAMLYQTFIDLDEFGVAVQSTDVCYANDQNQLDYTPMQLFAICLFSFVVVLVLSSSIGDLFVDFKRSDHLLLKLWNSFSVYRNLPLLFDTKTSINDEETKLSCLDGLRAISVVWVVYGHSALNLGRSALINQVDFMLGQENLWTIISSTTFSFAVDTFFVIGGFLATKSIKNKFELDHHRRIIQKFRSIPRIWLHRYSRLAPVVISSILFFTTIGTQLGSGPFWNSSMREIELCYDNWWSTIFFVQNYRSPDNMCFAHLWYLSADMHLFMGTTILLFLIHWKGLRYLLIVIAMIFASIFNNMFWYINYNFQWVNTKESNIVERDTLTYYPTHARMTSWLCGVILGIVYLKCLKNQNIKISSKLQLLGYMFCMIVVVAIVTSISVMTNSLTMPTPLQNAIFDSFSRLLWALAISLIIFKCITGNGGAVNKFLSASIWKPLANLSFCIYVFHYGIQLLKTGQYRTELHMDNIALVERFWSDFGMSVTISVFWTLAFEMPFRTIDKINYDQKIKSNRTKEC